MMSGPFDNPSGSGDQDEVSKRILQLLRGRTDNEAEQTKAPPSNAKKSKGKSSHKKDTGKPGRPLSAYNIFFKNERSRILQDIEKGDPGDDYRAKWKIALTRSKGSMSSAKFQAIATTIASRWNTLSHQDRIPFEQQAALEMKLYKKRKEEYQQSHIQKCQRAAEQAVKGSATKQYQDQDDNFISRRLPTDAATITPSQVLMLPSSSPQMTQVGSHKSSPFLVPPNTFAPTPMVSQPSQHKIDTALVLMMRQSRIQEDIARLSHLESRIKQQRERLQSEMIRGILSGSSNNSNNIDCVSTTLAGHQNFPVAAMLNSFSTLYRAQSTSSEDQKWGEKDAPQIMGAHGMHPP